MGRHIQFDLEIEGGSSAFYELNPMQPEFSSQQEDSC